MPGLYVIDGKTVRELLTMDLCIEVMGEAMIAATNKTVDMPPRLWTPLVDHSGSFGLMPGAASDLSVYGAKIIGLHPDNPAHKRPTVQGFVALFDHATGAPAAIVDGAAITAIRTAAVSGLATKLLARADVTSHGIFGTGAQAQSHAVAILAARPSIEEIVIWGRNHDKAKAVAEAIRKKTGVRVRATVSPEEAAACDVVTCVTAASTPILHGAWLRAGAHVNLVGPHDAGKREADTQTITRASVFVDLLDSAMREAGDIVIPIKEGAFSADKIVGEIGAVAQGSVRGRKSDGEITLLKSVGVVAQDIYAAEAVLRAAKEKGAGVFVNF